MAPVTGRQHADVTVPFYKPQSMAYCTVPFTRRARLLSFAVVSMGILIGRSAAGQANVRQRLLCDFEGDSALTGWELPGSEKPDWVDGRKTALSLSSDWAVSGSRSLKLSFGSYQSGEGAWRVIRLRLNTLNGSDWRGWDALELDVYHPGPNAERVLLEFRGGKVRDRLYGVYLEPGLWHVRIPTRELRVPTADRSTISAMIFATRQNRTPATIYVDNIRLVDRTSARLTDLLERVAAASELGSLSEAISSRSAVLAGLRRRIGEASERATAVLSPDDRDELAATVDRIEGDAADAFGGLTASALDTVTTALSRLRPGAPQTAGCTPLGAVQVEADAKAAVLTAASDRLGVLLGHTRLRAEIDRRFSDAPFVLGTPSAPLAMTDRPQAYAGALEGAVTIAAAQHEYEPCQLVIIPNGRDLRDVTVAATALRGPGVIGKEHVVVAPMGWRRHPADGREWADMLRPDITSFDVPRDVQQPVWINVFVPDTAVPGDYEGTLTVTAAETSSRSVQMHLRVWPFRLPLYASMHTAIHGWGRSGEHADENAAFVVAHRLNPMSIYQWPDPLPLAQMERWHEMGGTLFNLLRISRMGSSRFEAGPDGTLRFREKVKRSFFAHIDPRIKEIKAGNPALLEDCVLYGFDELGPEHVPALEEMYGLLKQRYGPARTMATMNLPLWLDHPQIRNLDIWVVLARLLTRELRDSLHAEGREVWWYNLYADQRDPVGNRVQFWATAKDGLDGVLHWNLRAGAEGGPHGQGLRSEAPRLKDRASWHWGGLIRRSADGRPLSTLALECWREGLEDCDYLSVLREHRNRLLASTPDARATHRYLLQDVDEALRVSDTVTRGIMGPDRADERSEVVLSIAGQTRDMHEIMSARRRIAELIVAVRNRL